MVTVQLKKRKLMATENMNFCTIVLLHSLHYLTEFDSFCDNFLFPMHTIH